MLAAQIAMPFPQPLGETPAKQIALLIHERAHGAIDEGQLRQADDIAGHLGHLGEVVDDHRQIGVGILGTAILWPVEVEGLCALS